TRVARTKIPEHAGESGNFGFAGVDDHYFLIAALTGGQPAQLRYADVSAPPASEGAPEAHWVSWSARYTTPPSGLRYFIGPKDFDVLASVERDLVRAIDFGMFSWLAVPLLKGLKGINGYVHNYGWSIISLTILINLLMFPLRH